MVGRLEPRRVAIYNAETLELIKVFETIKACSGHLGMKSVGNYLRTGCKLGTKKRSKRRIYKYDFPIIIKYYKD